MGLCQCFRRAICVFPAFWVSLRKPTRPCDVGLPTTARPSLLQARGAQPPRRRTRRVAVPPGLACKSNALEQLAVARSAEPASPHGADTGCECMGACDSAGASVWCAHLLRTIVLYMRTSMMVGCAHSSTHDSLVDMTPL